MLIFALQKLSVTTSSSSMKEKLPVVSGLGETFQWTNLQFALGGGGSGNNSNSSGSGNSSMWGGSASWWAGSNSTGAGGMRFLRDLASTPVAISREAMYSWHRGAKGIRTLARISGKHYNRWDLERAQRNETVGSVIYNVAATTVRRLAALWMRRIY